MTTPLPPTAPEGGAVPFWFADWRPDDVPISEWQLFWNECTANFRAVPPLAAQATYETGEAMPADMSTPKMLEWCGDNAQRWAQAWCHIATKLQVEGKPLIDEGWMIGWFANAIEHSTDVRRRAHPPKIVLPKIDYSKYGPFYTCLSCLEGGPEESVHHIENLHTLPDGNWICQGCYDDAPAGAYDTLANWNDLPKVIFPWMPIETAPRDGTWFIICRSGEFPDSIETGCYGPQWYDRYVDIGDGLFRKEQAIGYEWHGFNNFHRATHWTTLPAPPVDAMGDERGK